MYTTKTLNKYTKLIRLGRFTEQQLISFRKLVNGNPDSFEVSSLNNYFYTKANDIGIKLTKEQQSKGIEWLRRSTYKLNGLPRKNCTLNYFERRVIDQFKKFTCVGLYNINPNGYQMVPIYRCIGRDGSYFDYACLMWGEIQVLSIGKDGQSISHSNQPQWDLARQGFQSDRM